VALEKSDMGGEIHRYSLPDCSLDCSMKLETPVSALAVNPMTDLMAVGCETGTVAAFALSDEGFGEQLYNCQKHTGEVCCLTFAVRGSKLLSSAKDGTCLVWDDKDGSLLSEVTCEIPAEDPALNKNNNKNKRKQRPKGNAIVRGCAFGDLEGNIFYSVASYRMGSSYLYRWFTDQNDPSQYTLYDRVACTQSPVSAMSLSQDGGLLVMGTTESSVTLWGTAEWRPLKVFREVHGFLPTCAAARPFPVALQGEEDGVQVHARTGSGDGTIACMTLQKSAPGVIPNGSSGGYAFMLLLHRLLVVLVLGCIFSPVVKEAHTRCRASETMTTCLLQEGFYIPSSKLTIESRPY
jgi:WD40 repeat protein